MQHIKDTGFAPGTIVVATNFMARFHEFSWSMEDLRVPEGTRLVYPRSCDLTHNFNQGVRKSSGEWVWFMGDDHTFSPHILLNLLKHQVEVVQPLVTSKVAPWKPCIMQGPYEHGKPLRVYKWSEFPTAGLWKLPKDSYTGQAGLLVKKSVLDRLPDPWFRCGQLDPGRLQEDIYFCMSLHDLGVDIWQDCSEVLGHCGHIEAKPHKTHHGWIPGFKSGSVHIALPDLIDGEMDCSLETT